MLTTDRIELVKRNGLWCASFPPDSEVARLFGCTEIPTAFTDRAPAQRVLDYIAAEWAPAQVVIAK